MSDDTDLLDKRQKALLHAADHLWAWGWYDLADTLWHKATERHEQG